MNKAQQILKDVRIALGLEVKLAQMTLEDGITVIEAESFEPEFSVGIVTEEGIIALPVGEYVLEDGRTLVVTEEGIIAEIREAQAEEAPAEETAPEMAMEEAPAAPQAKKIVESIVKESFFAEIEQLKADNIALKAELEALKQPKVEEVVELSVEPITYNPENEQKVEPFRYSNKKEMSAIDRVMAKLS
jgi:hypothetical protein